MVVELLDAERVAKLRTDRLTYAEVGRTGGALPAGYRTFNRNVMLPTGIAFAAAARDLFRWQVHQRAGLHVAASSDQVEPDSVALLGLGVGRLTVRAPCRVVYVVNEPRRQGFAYGTLPGHLERGEEAFLLEQHDDGSVTFTIIAFSRPASTLAKIAGPLGRRVQDAITERYLRALTS